MSEEDIIELVEAVIEAADLTASAVADAHGVRLAVSEEYEGAEEAGQRQGLRFSVSPTPRGGLRFEFDEEEVRLTAGDLEAIAEAGYEDEDGELIELPRRVEEKLEALRELVRDWEVRCMCAADEPTDDPPGGGEDEPAGEPEALEALGEAERASAPALAAAVLRAAQAVEGDDLAARLVVTQGEGGKAALAPAWGWRGTPNPATARLDDGWLSLSIPTRHGWPVRIVLMEDAMEGLAAGRWTPALLEAAKRIREAVEEWLGHYAAEAGAEAAAQASEPVEAVEMQMARAVVAALCNAEGIPLYIHPLDGGETFARALYRQRPALFFRAIRQKGEAVAIDVEVAGVRGFRFSCFSEEAKALRAALAPDALLAAYEPAPATA